VRLATENVLSEFLREIKYIANVQEKQTAERTRRESRSLRTQESKQTLEEDDDVVIEEEEGEEEVEEPWEGEGSGAWVPGQGVYVDHAAIMDIIIQHLSYPGESPRVGQADGQMSLCNPQQWNGC
jgi:vacuole morphology and inheritance protein 14